MRDCDRLTLPPEAPWLAPPVLELVIALAHGYQQAFGRPLLTGASRFTPQQWAQELFVAPLVLLAHDGGVDPLLIYANRAALCLWCRPWHGLVGMPSRLTAEAEERASRSRALDQARLSGGLRGYGGIRIDSQGRRFRLSGARIWSLPSAAGSCCAQAAAFADWWWL